MWNWDWIDQESLAKRDKLKPINVAEEIIQRWHQRAEGWALGSNHILGLVEGNKTGKEMAKGWNFFSAEKTEQEYLFFWWHTVHVIITHIWWMNTWNKKNNMGYFYFLWKNIMESEKALDLSEIIWLPTFPYFLLTI